MGARSISYVKSPEEQKFVTKLPCSNLAWRIRTVHTHTHTHTHTDTHILIPVKSLSQLSKNFNVCSVSA